MSDQLPKPFVRMRDDYPQIAAAYDSLGEATGTAGPLDETSQHLVKLGMSIAAGLEGATHSHTRRALKAGVSPEAIRQVALLGISTLGLPRAMMGLTWINDILDQK
jgi:4-carboxymuconolactone decarboxylase